MEAMATNSTTHSAHQNAFTRFSQRACGLCYLKKKKCDVHSTDSGNQLCTMCKSHGFESCPPPPDKDDGEATGRMISAVLKHLKDRRESKFSQRAGSKRRARTAQEVSTCDVIRGADGNESDPHLSSPFASHLSSQAGEQIELNQASFRNSVICAGTEFMSATAPFITAPLPNSPIGPGAPQIENALPSYTVPQEGFTRDHTSTQFCCASDLSDAIPGSQSPAFDSTPMGMDRFNYISGSGMTNSPASSSEGRWNTLTKTDQYTDLPEHITSTGFDGSLQRACGSYIQSSLPMVTGGWLNGALDEYNHLDARHGHGDINGPRTSQERQSQAVLPSHLSYSLEELFQNSGV